MHAEGLEKVTPVLDTKGQIHPWWGCIADGLDSFHITSGFGPERIITQELAQPSYPGPGVLGGSEKQLEGEMLILRCKPSEVCPPRTCYVNVSLWRQQSLSGGEVNTGPFQEGNLGPFKVECPGTQSSLRTNKKTNTTEARLKARLVFHFSASLIPTVIPAQNPVSPTVLELTLLQASSLLTSLRSASSWDV